MFEIAILIWFTVIILSYVIREDINCGIKKREWRDRLDCELNFKYYYNLFLPDLAPVRVRMLRDLDMDVIDRICDWVEYRINRDKSINTVYIFKDKQPLVKVKIGFDTERTLAVDFFTRNNRIEFTRIC